MIYFTEGADISCSYTWYYNWCAKNKISVKRDCDEEIVQWILESYDQNISLGHQDVQEKAIEIYRNHMESDFKVLTCSCRWCYYNFCNFSKIFFYLGLLRLAVEILSSLYELIKTYLTSFRRIADSLRKKCTNFPSTRTNYEIDAKHKFRLVWSHG